MTKEYVSPLMVPLGVFNQNEHRWLEEGREGQYALVHEEEVVGFFETQDAGLEAGYTRFGNQAFLVRQIVRERPPLLDHRRIQAKEYVSPLLVPLGVFNRNEHRWLEEGREGQYALVREEDVIGFFGTLDEGLEAGYTNFGNRPFLVRPILKEHPPLRGHDYVLRPS